MKTRLTAIDIRALVMTLKRKIKSLRVANIYDVSNKLYLFKLAAKGKKEFLLVEAGIRMHTTEFVRNKNNIQSGFTMKVNIVSKSLNYS
jgi:predicted ribosome quality control (RQC) complex YloA/Tae2 family protein